MAEDRTQNPDDEQLPGSVSNQNSEEQLPEGGDQEEHRRPAARPRGDGESSGGPSEGTQSTGSPTSAG